MDQANIISTKIPVYYYYVTTKLHDYRELREADKVCNPSDKVDRAWAFSEKDLPLLNPEDQRNRE